MWVIIWENNSIMYGPFKTADAAAKYAQKNLGTRSYRIAPLTEPN